MRTLVEVYDPADEGAVLHYVQAAPRYPIDVAPDELEMSHLAQVWPGSNPNAAMGAQLWAKYAPGSTPPEALAKFDWPYVTPEAIYERLRADDIDGVTDLASDDEIWALVANLRQQATTPAALAQGNALYQQNCAACHGDQGRGDGFAAAISEGQEPDFSDLRASSGASPALYYAKIARGGMGTGMPNWGTILTEDELWALVDYLQTFTYEPAAMEK